MNSTTEPPSHEEAEIDVFPHPARGLGVGVLLVLLLASLAFGQNSLRPTVFRV
jgi:hypothetical protein